MLIQLHVSRDMTKPAMWLCAQRRLRSAWASGERGGSVVECRTPEREVRGSRPTAAVLCPWARHFTPRKYWLNTQEVMAPSRHDWKIVDWDVSLNTTNQPKPGHLSSLIRVSAVRIKKYLVLSYPLSAQRRLWSDWANAQADLSLCWAHTHFVGFVMSRLMCFMPPWAWWATVKTVAPEVLWTTWCTVARRTGRGQQCIRSYTAPRERWFWLIYTKAWNTCSCFITQLVFL